MRRRRPNHAPTTPQEVLRLYRRVLRAVPGDTRAEQLPHIKDALGEWGVDMVDVIRARIWERRGGR